MTEPRALDQLGPAGAQLRVAEGSTAFRAELSGGGRPALWAPGRSRFRRRRSSDKASHPASSGYGPSLARTLPFRRLMESIPNLVTVDLDDDATRRSATSKPSADGSSTRSTAASRGRRFFVPRSFAEATSLAHASHRGSGPRSRLPHDVSTAEGQQPYCPELLRRARSDPRPSKTRPDARSRPSHHAFAVTTRANGSTTSCRSGFEYDSSRFPTASRGFWLSTGAGSPCGAPLGRDLTRASDRRRPMSLQCASGSAPRAPSGVADAGVVRRCQDRRLAASHRAAPSRE